jgi:hypothetical protein
MRREASTKFQLCVYGQHDKRLDILSTRVPMPTRGAVASFRQPRGVVKPEIADDPAVRGQGSAAGGIGIELNGWRDLTASTLP